MSGATSNNRDGGTAPSGGGGRSYRFLAGQSVEILHTLGPKKAVALREWGVESVLDLITTYPHRYIDRTHQIAVADATRKFSSPSGAGGANGSDGAHVADEAHGAEVGESHEVVILADVRRIHVQGGGYGARRGGRGGRGRGRVEADVFDETGSLRIVFFNQPWRAKQLSPGTTALYSGKVSEYRGVRQLVNPAVDVLVDGREAEDLESNEGMQAASSFRQTLRIVPVYPQSPRSGLNSAEIGKWIAEALERSGRFAEPLPDAWREQLSLMDRTQALSNIHAPASMTSWEQARRRLAFDELFRLQLALVLRRRVLEKDAKSVRHNVSVLDVTGGSGLGESAVTERAEGSLRPGLVRRFLQTLPFELTQAQRRALAAIIAELAGPLPMHRLLQGDVGSGKTVIAVAALLAAVQGGHQGALMVPTEVLAEQHFMSVTAMLSNLVVEDATRLEGQRPVKIALLTNRTTARERTELHEGLRAGDVDIIVGTHALLTDEVAFHSLGVVVIDEQHRFGVEQRAALREKGRSSGSAADPDLLVMTATPIPRTAAMVLFGDLDMVVLDELPPGRTPVITAWAKTHLEEKAAWDRVRGEVAAGHRAFVVCPLVDESEYVEARSVGEEMARLSAGELEGISIATMHGQMSAGEKESVMGSFRDGEIAVLVATTVIEVGIDVPDATVMVIEDAGRFGLSQLHQLRGRVGRKDLPSWCFLLDGDVGPDATRRLAALEATNDGFALAEIDLDIRGEGTILGARQKGRSDLVLASLREHGDLLDAAGRVAEALVNSDDALVEHPLLEDEVKLFLDPEDEEFLFKS